MQISLLYKFLWECCFIHPFFHPCRIVFRYFTGDSAATQNVTQIQYYLRALNCKMGCRFFELFIYSCSEWMMDIAKGFGSTFSVYINFCLYLYTKYIEISWKLIKQGTNLSLLEFFLIKFFWVINFLFIYI